MNGLFNKVLGDWVKSREEFHYPDRLVENHGVVYAPSTKKVAAGALRDAIEDGEVYIGVRPICTSPVFEVGIYKKTTSSGKEQDKYVAAFFPGNFFARCVADGIKPEVAVADSLVKLLYWDVKVKSDNIPRKIFSPRKPRSIVRIVRRKRSD